MQCTPVIPALERKRWVSVSSRLIWSTYRVSGPQGLFSVTSFQKQQQTKPRSSKQTNKQTPRDIQYKNK